MKKSSSPQSCTSQGQRGNALLYTLLALVLGGIGVAVGVQQYQDAERSTTVQSTVAEVNAIMGAAKQNFGQYSYAGLTTAIAVGSQVIPQSMANGVSAINRFGQPVDLVVTAPGAGTATLTYEGVPSNVCTSIVNGTQAPARAVTVGSSPAKPLDGFVDLAELNTGCTSGSAVTIAWTIGRT